MLLPCLSLLARDAGRSPSKPGHMLTYLMHFGTEGMAFVSHLLNQGFQCDYCFHRLIEELAMKCSCLLRAVQVAG